METPRYSDDNRSLHRSKLGLLCEKAISSHCLVVSNEFYLVSSQIYTTKFVSGRIWLLKVDSAFDLASKTEFSGIILEKFCLENEFCDLHRIPQRVSELWGRKERVNWWSKNRSWGLQAFAKSDPGPEIDLKTSTPHLESLSSQFLKEGTCKELFFPLKTPQFPFFIRLNEFWCPGFILELSREWISGVFSLPEP